MRRVLLGVAVAALLAGAGGAVAYRETGPRLHGGAFGTSTVVGRLGAPASIGMQLWADEPVRIDDVDELGGAGVRVEVSVHHEPGVHIGTCICDGSGLHGRPARGARIAGTRSAPVDLLVTVRPDELGTYRLRDLRVRYGEGLRQRSLTIPGGACIIVAEAPPTSLPTCDLGAGRPFFEPAATVTATDQ